MEFFNSVHSNNPASVEVTGLINSVSKRMNDIEGKLDETTMPKKKAPKEKIPLSIKVYIDSYNCMHGY